ALDAVPKDPVAGRAALRVLRNEGRRNPGRGRRDRRRVHRLRAWARLSHDPGAVVARYARDGDGRRAPDIAGRGAIWARARLGADVRGPRYPVAVKTRKTTMLLTRDTLPATIADIAALDELLCRPSQALIDDLRKVDGDIMILGVAGKTGPTLAGLAKAAAPDRRIIGVARFSDASVKDWLQARGIETINCDLMEETAIHALPKAPNIVFMAGRKFGAEGDLSLTWAMNSHVPALVAQAFSA